jgi:hypothetical protein
MIDKFTISEEPTTNEYDIVKKLNEIIDVLNKGEIEVDIHVDRDNRKIK